MSRFVRDAQFGFRLFRRNPGFTLLAVGTLAVGIAATTAIFSVVYGLFFAPLPYHQPDSLVMVWEYIDGQRASASPSAYTAWKRQADTFADINAWGGRSVNIATADRPENVSAGVATPGFLPMLGYGQPYALGRTFADEEGVPGRERVVILTYKLWKDHFGGDPAIVGRHIRVDDVLHTVVGVMGEGPADHQQNKIWLPLALTEAEAQSDNHSLLVMARLKEGLSVQEADARMTALSARLERERSRPRRGFTVHVQEFRNNFVTDSTKQGIWLLLGAVMFLLLIACANVANLLLARGTTRHREVAIRVAIGATRASVIRQLLVESLVLAVAGGLVGTLMALSIIEAIVALMPPFTLPSETEITLSIPVLLFTLVICTLTGVAAGLAPAWQASRTSAAETMKDGARTVGDRRFGLRRALVVLEFALALTLLAGGGMAVHALVQTMSVDVGFRADHLTTFRVPVPRGRFASAEQALVFYESLSERLNAVPGVASASISTGMPIRGVQFGRNFAIVGERVPEPENWLRTGVNMVTPSYHLTFGIPIRRGRTFTNTDVAGGKPVVIVNETFASRFLPGRDPIGQRLLMAPFRIVAAPGSSPPVEWEIVGVQGNTANSGPGRPDFPEVLLPFAQNPWPTATVAVRTSAGMTAPRAVIADILQAVDPTLPMTDVETVEQTLSQSTADDRFYTVFFAAFAGVALLLAAVGIYGVMSFGVAQRTHEIGLRIALGGGPAQVLAQVLREGMLTALAGTALGAIGAVFIGRLIGGAVYGVEPANPITFAIVAMTLLLAALVACMVPAHRAASVDPMVALRQD